MFEKMNRLFKTGQAGNADDFIIFILEQIHKELKVQVKSSFLDKIYNLTNMIEIVLLNIFSMISKKIAQ